MLRALLCVVVLSAPASAFDRPRLPRLRSRAVRMSDEKRGGEGPALALPSLQTFGFVFIGGQSATSLSTELPRLLAGATPAPYFAVAANAGFLAWSVYNLAKQFGLGKKDFYGSLDDLTVGSLARDAGEWALSAVVPTRSTDGQYEVATFAGGCFWGTELHFQRLPGVVATCVGYTQGAAERPSYAQVCSGLSGHTEGLMLTYDPTVISFETLCDKLLGTVDSSALNRVGNDRGTQYRHGIYFHTPEQAAAAARAIAREQTMQTKGAVVTEVLPAAVFWPAENYHQRYLQKGGQSAAKNAKEAVRCYG